MRTLATALAAGVLAGCASVLAGCASGPIGRIDDRGRAFETTNEAPVAANLEPLAAEPTIELFNDRLPGFGRGSDQRAEGADRSACQAERWQRLIGMRKADVEEQQLPDDARVVDWGDAVTQDYEPKRLNVQLDQGGRVYRVICG
jgi:hypothetical protein